MEHQLLKQLLDIVFYTDHKDKLSRTLFEDEVQELYDIVVEAHGKYGADLTVDELYNLWLNDNPTATNSNKAVMQDVIKKIDSETKFNQEIASDLLKGMWERDLGKRIADIGLDLAQGQSDSYSKLLQLIEKSKDGILPDDYGDETTKDLVTLLDITSNDHRFRFNIPLLAKHCYGIGPAEFAMFYARPETGKTAFGVSLACAPGGWCEQGHKVLYLGNEEKTMRTMLRAYSSYTGMKRDEIAESPKLAQDRFNRISENITMKDCNGWGLDRVEGYIDKIRPRIVIVDQGDKISIEGNYAGRTHEKLKDLYTGFRELWKRTDTAGLVASQASDLASGKTIVTPDMLENSKTGKFAEVDMGIGIGKVSDNQDGVVDPIRYLTIGKNKLNGWHGTIAVKLEQDISRYED